MGVGAAGGCMEPRADTAWKGLVSGDGRTFGVARVWLERSRGKDVLGALASRAGRWTLLGKRPGL